jgi:hypothetical protein
MTPNPCRSHKAILRELDDPLIDSYFCLKLKSQWRNVLSMLTRSMLGNSKKNAPNARIAQLLRVRCVMYSKRLPFH